MSFFPEYTPQFAELVGGLTGKRIAVLGHLRPDADCVGSQVALCRLLLANGIEATCVNWHPIPRILTQMVGDTPFANTQMFDPSGWTPVAVDCADGIRFGEDVGRMFPEIHANIDHHISNTAYSKNNLIDPTAAATGEMLAGMLMDLEWPLDGVTAQALYTAIATDTGMFRYETTSPRVFEICAELMRRGARPAITSQWLYENEPFEKIELLREFLESLTVTLDGRLCYGVLPLGCFERTGTNKEDAEGFVDYARDVAGVEIGLLLEEYEAGKTKGSLRAVTPKLRVDKLARKLGGGGHAAAAGFNQPKPLDAFLPEVLEATKAHFNTLS